MKSLLFGLALLAALPGCCGWCKEDKKCKKPCDKKMMKSDEDMSMNGNGKSSKSKSYKK